VGWAFNGDLVGHVRAAWGRFPSPQGPRAGRCARVSRNLLVADFRPLIKG
ncbi:hypothetical protein T492DRAFT_1059906, partial [Pavlovales sp. CCMP2436]